MPAKNEEDSIEKEVEYCERLLRTIEGMPVVPNLPRIIAAHAGTDLDFKQNIP